MGGRLAIAAWLAALGLAAVIASQARYVADLSSFLPAAPTPAQRLLVDQLRDGALSRVMLIGIQGGDDMVRARLSKALAAALRNDARFTFVANGEGAGFERERGLLLAQRYVLSPQVTPARFEAAGLRAALLDTLDALASPAGLFLKSLVPRDPTGELLAVIEALQPADGPPLAHGAWASPDGTRAVLMARTRASGADLDAQAEAVAAVEAAFANARGAAGTGEARLLLSGAGVFSARSRAMIEHDVTRLSAASALLVIALLLAVYRSGRALALGFVPVVSGAAAGIAAVALGFDAVHGITLGFGTTLIGEAVDYSIYLFVQSPAQRFWATIRTGVLTSIAGFSALVFSGLPGLAQLGVYSIAGLVAAALVTRYVLPSLLPAGFAVRDLTRPGEGLLDVARGLGRLRWAVPALAIAALAVVVAKGPALWDRDIASLNPITAADRAVDAQLRAALGATDARHMVVAGGESADAALAAAERVEAALAPLVASGSLAGIESPARFLPSLATQRARLASLPEPGVLQARLAEATKGLPIAAAKLEPFVQDVARARVQPPLTREALEGTALAAAVEGLLVRGRDSRWSALVGLRGGAKGIEAVVVRDALDRAGLRDATLLDVKGEVDGLYAGYFERALWASLAGLAVIVALLAATLRAAARVTSVMVPITTAVLLVAAGHAALGSKLSLLHLVGLLLVVAIGSNYALFFERLASDPGVAAPRTLASLVLANLTTVAGFGALSLSSIPVLSAIGSTVALGTFLSLLLAAAFSGLDRRLRSGGPPPTRPAASG